MAAQSWANFRLDDSGAVIWTIPYTVFRRTVDLQRANGVPHTEVIRCEISGRSAVLSDADMNIVYDFWPGDGTLSNPTPSSEVKTSTEAARSLDVKPIAKLKPAPKQLKHDLIDLTSSPPAKKSTIDPFMPADNLSFRNTIDLRSSPPASDDMDQLFINRGPPARAAEMPSSNGYLFDEDPDPPTRTMALPSSERTLYPEDPDPPARRMVLPSSERTLYPEDPDPPARAMALPSSERTLYPEDPDPPARRMVLPSSERTLYPEDPDPPAIYIFSDSTIESDEEGNDD